MKPQWFIPPRTKSTEEQQRQMAHSLMITSLFERWINNQLLPTDTLLVIQHLEELESIKQSMEWHNRFQQDKLDWQCQQMQQDYENSQKKP